jgi:glycosyltransferase involved in cell wall biosynthesis
MSKASITAVIPVYRGENTIEASVMSVIEQNVKDLEILIFDDGSPDRSAQILEELLAKLNDSRVTLYRQENCGLAGTLNRGISLAIGGYIARQDQDDIVLPGRLETQRAFLEENKDVAMVGTWAQIHVGDAPSERYHRHAAADDALRLELLFDNPFVHSSVMLRTEIVRNLGGYSIDKSRQPPEDYELWSRIARSHKVANIPEVLTIYREMPASMSRVGTNPFLENVVKISSENLHHAIGEQFSFSECVELSRLYHGMSSEPTLSRKQVRIMLQTAAEAVGGKIGDCSGDFQVSLTRMKRHLDARYYGGKLPKVVIPALRKLKRAILGRSQ